VGPGLRSLEKSGDTQRSGHSPSDDGHAVHGSLLCSMSLGSTQSPQIHSRMCHELGAEQVPNRSGRVNRWKPHAAAQCGQKENAPARVSRGVRGQKRLRRTAYEQPPANQAARKSKRSWTVTLPPLMLASGEFANQPARKSKRSWTVMRPTWL